MGNTIQYSVNIAMEAIMILIMIFLLVSCFLQKKRFSTTKALVIMTGATLLLLAVQITTWLMLLFEVHLAHNVVPIQIAYIFDFSLSFSIHTIFFFYMDALIKDGYELCGIKYKRNWKVGNAIVFVGIVSTILYCVGIFNPSIFRIEDGEMTFSIPAYILMHAIILLPEFVTVIVLYQHRKAVKKSEGTLLVLALIVPSLLSIADELWGLSISYIFLSLFIVVMYLRIDLRKELIIEEQEKNLTELKTDIMLSQLQPHFLYNVFTTISGLCEMQDAIEARDVVNNFADYFRVNLDSLGRDKFIPFEKELEHVKTYLWLEKVRFEDSLNINYEIGTTAFTVPSLAVQPIVENAVKHGIHAKEDAGTLTIRTYETETHFVIEIEDDGVGFDPNELIGDNYTHVGIKNVSGRLKTLCGGSLEIQSEKGKGTLATIRIPKGGTN